MRRVLLYTKDAKIPPKDRQELLDNGIVPVRVANLEAARLMESEYANAVLESAMEAIAIGRNSYINYEFTKRLKAKLGKSLIEDSND